MCITSVPVLARFDTTRPTFLKTDWSSEGMGWILMQPSNENETQAASKQLLVSGEYLFDLSKQGARLQPIAFGSRSCTLVERRFHSFTGKAASGRWSIEQNRKYLWGSHFWWICDCSSVKEVLKYNGTIPLVCRWAQGLLGYQFTMIHRPNRMIADVDSLTRRYGPLIAMYCMVSSILHQRDTVTHPLAYETEIFHNSATAKLTPPVFSKTPIPELHNGYITATCAKFNEFPTIVSTKNTQQITSSSSILYTSFESIFPKIPSITPVDQDNRILTTSQSFFSDWWIINDVIGSQYHWFQSKGLWRCHCRYIFIHTSHRFIFLHLHKHQNTELCIFDSLLFHH